MIDLGIELHLKTKWKKKSPDGKLAAVGDRAFLKSLWEAGEFMVVVQCPEGRL